MCMRLHVLRVGCGRQALLYLGLAASSVVGLSPALHAADKGSAENRAFDRLPQVFAVTDRKSAPPRILEISLAKGAPQIVGEIVVNRRL